MNIETIRTTKMTMRFFRFGNENGKPFVIIPGAALKSVMLSAELIAAQYSALAGDFNVHVFDRREDIPEVYSIYDMADDTAEAMDSLGLTGSVVYGVSQGGMIAQAMAVRRPELVERLILCSTAPYIPEASAKIVGEWARCAENRDVPGLMKAFAENVYSEAYLDKYRDAFAAFGKSLTEDDLARFVLSTRSIGSFDIREHLGKIKCPLLVIAADNDRIFGTEPSAEIAERTGGELVVCRGESHAVYDEDPSVIVRTAEFAFGKRAVFVPEDICFLNDLNEKRYETNILTLHLRSDGSAVIEDEVSSPGSSAGNTFGGKFYRELPCCFWRELTAVQIAGMYPSLTEAIIRDGRLAGLIERLKSGGQQ